MKKIILALTCAVLLYACGKKENYPPGRFCWNLYDHTGYFEDTSCDKTEAEIKAIAGNGGYERFGDSRFCWTIKQQNGWTIYLSEVSEMLLHSLYETNLGATASQKVDCIHFQNWFNRKEAIVGGALVYFEPVVKGFMPEDDPADDKKIFLYTSGDTTWQRHYSNDPWF